MANVSNWSANELENIFLDDQNLSDERGKRIAKLMAAVKGKTDAIDAELAISGGAATVYCADCNETLSPGVYYIDESTANSPSGGDGILEVRGTGGEDDPVFQFALCVAANSVYVVEHRRRVLVSGGVFASASVWQAQSYIGLSRRALFTQDAAGLLVLTPPHGSKPNTVSSSTYETMRFVHPRDVTRDATQNSYWYAARYTDDTSPQEASKNDTKLLLCPVEGGIPGVSFVFDSKLNCFSNVVYTDSTTETIRGVFHKAGDVIDEKTVASVTYSREFDTLAFYAFQDNLMTLGLSNYRLSTIYAGTDTINTSDERLKSGISDIPDEVLDAWGDVGWRVFQFNDAVEKKGAGGARLHAGAVAQRIEAVFTAHGLDASRFGLFCHDSWEGSSETDDGGQIQEPGDCYSLRYAECFAMEAAYQRRRADRIEARIEALEAAVNGSD